MNWVLLNAIFHQSLDGKLEKIWLYLKATQKKRFKLCYIVLIPVTVNRCANGLSFFESKCLAEYPVKILLFSDTTADNLESGRRTSSSFTVFMLFFLCKSCITWLKDHHWILNRKFAPTSLWPAPNSAFLSCQPWIPFISQFGWHLGKCCTSL